MKQRMTSRVIALVLALVMTVGLLPASAFGALLPEQPPVETQETAEQLPAEPPDSVEGSEPEVPPEEERPAPEENPEPEAPPMQAGLAAEPLAGEAPFLPVEGDTDFATKPMLNARFLAGDGSDTTLPFQMTDISYRLTRSIGGMLQISLQADGTQTNRKLKIAMPKGTQIGAYTAADRITTGATVERIYNSTTGGTTLTYTLKDGEAVNFTVTVGIYVYVEGTYHQYLYPGQILRNSIAYSAMEGGTAKVAAVTEAANFIAADLPSSTLLKEHSTFSSNQVISNAQIKTGYQYSKVPLIKSNSDDDRAAYTDWAPCISGFRIKLRPKDPKVQIVNCSLQRSDGTSVQSTNTVSKEADGSYIFTMKCDERDILLPFTHYVNVLYQPFLVFTIQNKNPVYGEEYEFVVEEYSLLVPNANGLWSGVHKQTTPTAWTLKARVKEAPIPCETSVSAYNTVLYFSNPAGLKLTDSTVLYTYFTPSYSAEIEPFVNPCLTVTLPDGLSEQTMLSFEKNYFSGVQMALSYDNQATWVEVASGTSGSNGTILLSKNAGGKLPTHARFTGLQWSQNGNYNISLKNAYGDTYRNGTKVADGDKREFTATFTADNLAALPAHTSTGTITYKEYTPPVKENQIRLSEWGDYNDYTGLDVYGDNRYGMNDVDLYCSANKTAIYDGAVRIQNWGAADATISHTNAKLLLKSEKYAELTGIDFANTREFKLSNVKINLSDGSTVTKTAAQLPYDAPGNLTITTAEYLFSELPIETSNYAKRLSYNYQLPPSGLTGTDLKKPYFSLTFLESDQVPLSNTAAVRPSFTVERDAFRGMANIIVNLPNRLESGSHYVPSSATAGSTFSVSSNGTNLQYYSADAKAYKSTQALATFKPVNYVLALRIEKSLRYVNGSISGKDSYNNTANDVPCTAKFEPAYFSNGDGLLRIVTQKPTASFYPKFQLAVNIDAKQGNIVTIPEQWFGADFSGAAALDKKTLAADGLPGCSITYWYAGYKTEAAAKVDVNGDGKLGDTAASVAIEGYPPSSTLINELRQEGIFSYGTGTEDNVESATNAQYYGAMTDTYTYRTFFLAQQANPLNKAVMYIPIPRAGVAATGNAAKNQWDAQLTGIEGKVLTDTKGTYTLLYSTVEKPTMLELAGGTGDNDYLPYDPAHPPVLSTITMLKIKAATLPQDTADDIKLTFTGKGAKPAAGALTNHMESYYLYMVNGKAVSGPTRSIYYTLASNSISGTAFIDTDYDGAMNIAGGADNALAGLTVTLYDKAGNAVPGKTATTDSGGNYVIEAPTPGIYSIGVSAEPLANRKLLDKGTGSVVDKTSGKSALLTVTRSGISGQNIGYRDKRSFTLYKDIEHKQEVTADTVMDISLGGEVPIRYTLSPGYALDNGNLLTITADIPGKLTAVKGSAFAFSLFGNQTTTPGQPVTLTVTMPDGQGGTQTNTFKARVLPPRVIAKFENNMNFYATVEYDKDELLGGISYLNSTSLNEKLTPIKGEKINADGTVAGEFTLDDPKTFSEAEIGMYRITYTGNDVYGRPIVDENGSETVTRNIYIHGYPYLKETSPLQRRVGEGYTVMRNQDGSYLSATHKHIYPVQGTGGWVAREDETYSADPKGGQNITQLGFRPYATDGSDFDDDTGKLVERTDNNPLLTTLPTTPGAYEVHYAVRMADKAAILPVHRTLYQHGSPQLYIPSVITIKPQPDVDAGSAMDLNYAAAQVWSNESLMMRDMAHVQESGKLITYNWDSTRLFFIDEHGAAGPEITADQVPNYHPSNPGSGNYVIAAPAGQGADGQDLLYNVAPLAPDAGSTLPTPANVFIKKDSLNVLKNTPGTYHMTMVFRDNIDGMGTAGTEGQWNENWASLYKENGNGYVETEIKVLVTGADNLPVMPDQALLRPNFVATDSAWFTELRSYRNKTVEQIKAANAAEGAALEADIAARHVFPLDNGEGLLFYYKAIPTPADAESHVDSPTNDTTSLMKLFTQAMRFRIHDVDIHSIKPTGGGGDTLTAEEYKDIHDAAVSLLWNSTVVTKLESPRLGQDGNDVYENPTYKELLKVVEGVKNSDKQAAAIEMTLQVSNINITPAAGTPDDEELSDGIYVKHGYKVELKSNETVKETYKFYIHSPLAFERAGNLPLVTYGLHIPYAAPHTAMDVNAFFYGAKALQKNVFAVSSPDVNISTPGTYTNMDYTYAHPIQVLLPTLRENTSHYLGRAFVNGRVELLHEGGAIHSSVRGEAGKPIDLTEGYTVQVDKWTNLVEYAPEDMGKEYPKVKGVDGAADGAEFKTAQPANLKIYDSTNLFVPIFNSDAGTTLPQMNYTSALPGVKTMVYVAEDLPPDANHPYHNGPNRKEISVQYIFDGPISLSYGSDVKGTGDAKTLTVLNTATDDEIKAAIAAKGRVNYGETPATPSAADVTVAIARTTENIPASATVTATDKNGRSVSETITITAQRPAVIKIAVVDAADKPISGVTVPDITGAVIGRPYTVLAPQVEGYRLTSASVVTIPAVTEGENKVQFKYDKVDPDANLTSYTVSYMAGGQAILQDTRMGLVDDTVSHTAPAVFYVGEARYILSATETTNPKTLQLTKSGPNEITFAYEADALPVSVAYRAEYTYEGAAVETVTDLGTVGKEVTLTAPAKFTKGTFAYTLKAGETNPRTITLLADKNQNVARFAYDRAAVDNGGGGDNPGGGSTPVNYYSVLYMAEPYGTMTGKSVLQVKSGGKPDSIPKVTPKEGYTFLGWYTDDMTKLVDPAKVTITEATVFRAAFKAPDGTTVGPDGSGQRPIPELELTDHIAYMVGDENGNFRPDAGITRAEVVVLFSRLLKEKMPADVALTSRFKDVAADKWYANTVAYMEQFGIITGYDDGTFRPEAPIARSEFVAIASRFSQLELTDKQLFPDVPADDWAAVYINSAKLKGWITGYEDGTFRPTQTIARAEAAKIVNALLGRSPDQAYIDAHADKLKRFPDLATAYWAYYEITEAANAHDHTGSPERWTKLK